MHPTGLTTPTTLLRIACLAAVLGLVGTACVVRDNGSEAVPGDYSLPTGTYDGGSDSGITGDGAASATPMLVKIDSNTTMNASPGQGVGVFTEYDTGGHWYVWWTCDTSISNQSCAYEVILTVDRGVISNVSAEGFAAPDTALTLNGKLAASTTTTTMVQGLHFDSDPGAVLTVSAALGGAYSGSFMFFVQDRTVNGGYMGSLTDPLEFEAALP